MNRALCTTWRAAAKRTLLVGCWTAGIVSMSLASSHREAPAISTDPSADNTDTYLFVSPDNPDNVVLVGCWWPIEDPAGGPNWFHFDPEAEYVFHIDNDGDAKEEITFVFRFDTEIQDDGTFLYAKNTIDNLSDPDWNFRQTYDLLRVEGVLGKTTTLAEGLQVPPVNIGPRTTPNYEQLAAEAYYDLDDDIKVFAGQRDDPFFVDLGAIFDLLAFRVPTGNMGQGLDDLSGMNVQAIAIEIPIEQLTYDGSSPSDPGDPAAVLGMWATTRRAKPMGSPIAGYDQVSRLGMPLVNEVVIPLGDKDKFNASRPIDDPQFLDYVVDPELAQIIEALYGVTAPPAPRCDLVSVFLTGVPGLNQPPNVVPGEMLRVNVAIKPDDDNSRFGVLAGDLDGFPNGRRLSDDVVDIAERVVAGVLYPAFCDPDFMPHPAASQLGDGVDVNDLEFDDKFPYLATPHQGFDHDHHRIEDPHPAELVRSVRSKSMITPRKVIETNPELKMSLANPVRGNSAALRFALPESGNVSLYVYDASGRRVQSVFEGSLGAGEHTYEWDLTDDRGAPMSNGIYFTRLELDGQQIERKVVVLKVR